MYTRKTREDESRSHNSFMPAPAGTVTVTTGAGMVFVIVAEGEEELGLELEVVIGLELGMELECKPVELMDAGMTALLGSIDTGLILAEGAGEERIIEDIGVALDCAGTVTVTVGFDLAQNHWNGKGQDGGASGVNAAVRDDAKL